MGYRRGEREGGGQDLQPGQSDENLQWPGACQGAGDGVSAWAAAVADAEQVDEPEAEKAHAYAANGRFDYLWQTQGVEDILGSVEDGDKDKSGQGGEKAQEGVEREFKVALERVGRDGDRLVGKLHVGLGTPLRG